MPNIEFDEDTLTKVKTRTGVYSSLRNQQYKGKEQKQLIPEKRDKLSQRLGDEILRTIEAAFKEYALAHTGCTLMQAQTEWKRFYNRLRKYL